MIDDDPPEGFVRLHLPPAGFIDGNGPLYGRRADGRFMLGLRVRDRHCNSIGLCHGGMLATLADMLLATGSSLQGDLPSFLRTVSPSCDYLGTVANGAWVEGRVEVLRVTRSFVFSQGLLEVADRPVLRASGILERPDR